jgi:hypothetical protein
VSTISEVKFPLGMAFPYKSNKFISKNIFALSLTSTYRYIQRKSHPHTGKENMENDSHNIKAFFISIA